MGILDLNRFLNDNLKIPRTREYKLILLAGMQIAVDGHNWAYANIARANSIVVLTTHVDVEDPDRELVIQRWLNMALDTVCIYLSHQVVPVFVFDGVHIPEKGATQEKRKQEKIKVREEIDAIREELKDVSPLDRDPKKIKRLESLLSRSNYISKEEMSKLQHLLISIGIPVLQSKGEAEQLCSSLAKEGLVAAAFSKDTDTLVYGCPLTITSFGNNYQIDDDKRNYRNLVCVSLNDVLNNFSWTHEQFVDFCITISCDFNKRMRGFGTSKAYKLIQEYKSIDNFPDSLDITPLNHKKCRLIFNHQPPIQVIDDEDVPVTNDDLQINKSVFFDCGRSTMDEYALDKCYYPRLFNLYKEMPNRSKSKIISLPERRMIKIKRATYQEDS